MEERPGELPNHWLRLKTCPETVRLGTEQHCVMERIDGGERALAVALPPGDGSVLQPQTLG